MTSGVRSPILMKKGVMMKKYALALVFCLTFLAPALIAKDEPKIEVIFESALKDAIYCPLYDSELASLRTNFSADVGWWTLKFENGAVIRYWKNTFINVNKADGDIWWIGKVYVVSKIIPGSAGKLAGIFTPNKDQPAYFSVSPKESVEPK